MANYDDDVLIEISTETSGKCNACGAVTPISL